MYRPVSNYSINNNYFIWYGKLHNIIDRFTIWIFYEYFHITRYSRHSQNNSACEIILEGFGLVCWNVEVRDIYAKVKQYGVWRPKLEGCGPLRPCIPFPYLRNTIGEQFPEEYNNVLYWCKLFRNIKAMTLFKPVCSNRFVMV